MYMNGIVDLAVAKISKEEEQQAKQIEAINLKAQQNYLKAARQAMLLTQASNNFDDADTVMKNMRMAPTPVKQFDQETYNKQIEKIADGQNEYTDEYEGFGSLTEMIKNTDKIAEKEATKVMEIKKVKDQAEQKIQTIKAAKSKMAEALNKSVKEKKEKQEAAKKTKVIAAATNSTVKEQAQPPSDQLKAIQGKQSEGEKISTLLDSQVSQVIDEVQNEDPTATTPTAPADDTVGGEANDQFRGFIGKFTSKFKRDDKPEEDANNVQTAEEETPKPTKGMFARFQEQIHQDEADSEKAKEVVLEYQHAMDIPNKSILDRETERLVQEQDDEYALDADVASAADV